MVAPQPLRAACASAGQKAAVQAPSLPAAVLHSS